MRKWLIALLVFFIIISICLPFFIEWLYIIGETNPIIITRYTQSEVLSYISSVISGLVALSALVISIDSTQPHFRVKEFARVGAKDGSIIIELSNSTGNDYEVKFFRLIDDNKIIMQFTTEPIVLKAHSVLEYKTTYENLSEHIMFAKDDMTAHFLQKGKYQLRLSSDSSFLYNARGLNNCIKLWEDFYGPHEI